MNNRNAVANTGMNSTPALRPPRPANAWLNSRGRVPGALHSNAVASHVVNSDQLLRPLRPAKGAVNSRSCVPGALI